MTQVPPPSPITGTSHAYSKDNILLMLHQRLHLNKYVPPELISKIESEVSSYLLVHKEQRLFTAVDTLLRHHSL